MSLSYIGVLTLFCLQAHSKYTNTNHPHQSRVRNYPKNTVFRKSDLIDIGCSVFIRFCPRAYKCRCINIILTRMILFTDKHLFARDTTTVTIKLLITIVKWSMRIVTAGECGA